MPVNYLLIEALERYHHFWGPALSVTIGKEQMDLAQAAMELQRRLVSLFLPNREGLRPIHGDERRFSLDPHFRDLLLFHEYFHAETGRGCGASHQTGWTALVGQCIENLCRGRTDQGLGPRVETVGAGR